MKKCKYYVCCIILIAMFVTSSCGNHKNTQQSDTHQGSGAETPDIAQQPGLAEKGNHGSVLASYGVVLPVSRPSIYVDVAGYASGREKR